MEISGHVIQPSFHFTPNVQASIVISSKHAALGGDTGFLGPATSSVVADLTDSHGYHIDYKGGHIYRAPTTGAHAIYGDIYAKWMTKAVPKAVSVILSQTKHPRLTNCVASTILPTPRSMGQLRRAHTWFTERSTRGAWLSEASRILDSQPSMRG